MPLLFSRVEPSLPMAEVQTDQGPNDGTQHHNRRKKWVSNRALPGRPAHRTAAQDMEMEVEDSLSRLGTGIGDHAIAAIGDPFFSGHPDTDKQEVPEQRGVMLAALHR